MILKGGWSPNLNGTPALRWVFTGDKLLADILEYNYLVYRKWLKNKRKLSSIGNFGIDESTTKEQTNKAGVQGREESEGFSPEDLPF
jgi:hypothetical protein